MRLRSAFLALGLSLVLCTGHAGTETNSHAGTAVRLSLDELFDGAGLVVEGRVQRSRVLAAPNGRIDTEYTVAVDRTFWGTDQSTVTLRLPGGMLPSGRGLVVPGVAHPVVGEDNILLMTEAAADGLRLPVGLAQGRFRVVVNSEGRRLAVRDQRQLTTITAGQTPEEAPNLAVFDYASLVAELERAAATRRATGSAVRPTTGSEEAR